MAEKLEKKTKYVPMLKCTPKPGAEEGFRKWQEEYEKGFNAKVEKREALKREAEARYMKECPWLYF
jgi:hypothetical protein